MTAVARTHYFSISGARQPAPSVSGTRHEREEDTEGETEGKGVDGGRADERAPLAYPGFQNGGI